MNFVLEGLYRLTDNGLAYLFVVVMERRLENVHVPECPLRQPDKPEDPSRTKHNVLPLNQTITAASEFKTTTEAKGFEEISASALLKEVCAVNMPVNTGDRDAFPAHIPYNPPA